MRTSTFYNSLLAATFSALLGLAALPVRADDTEIYVTPSSQASSSNVMLVLDYRPSTGSNICSDITASGCAAGVYFRSSPYTAVSSYANSLTGSLTLFGLLRLSMLQVLYTLNDPASGLNSSSLQIGLMLNHNDTVTGNRQCVGYVASPQCSNGGFIVKGFQPITSTYVAQLQSILTGLAEPSGSTSIPYQGREVYFELFRYLTGQGIFNAHNNADDSSGNGSNLSYRYGTPLATFDPSIEQGSGSNQIYTSPLTSGQSCGKNFVINFFFDSSGAETNSNTAIAAAYSAGGLNLPSGSSSTQFDTIVKRMYDLDLSGQAGIPLPYGTAVPGTQNVTSFFVVPPSGGGTFQQKNYDLAIAGGTTNPVALASDAGTLVENILNIFRQVLSVSTTFTAASVPVNVFNRAQVLDSAFLALFQPNANASWNGNLKKLKLGISSTTGLSELVDANNTPAVSQTDGRILNSALTFWTSGAAITDNDTDHIAGRDGRSVIRGGAGQRLPGYIDASSVRQSPGDTNTAGPRKVFYDSGAATLSALDATTAVADALIATGQPFAGKTQAEALQLIKFMRGQLTSDTQNPKRYREWAFGDPLHSRPIPINYGATGGYTASNPAVYVAVGGNDGLLHFVRNTTTSSAQSGVEAWAFAPKSTMGIQPTLLLNPLQGALQPHPYGVDGTPSVLVKDNNGDGNIDSSSPANDKVVLFVPLRRGGRGLYALDVSNPESPQLLWKIDNTTSGFSELGLTFSTPKVGKVTIPNSTPSTGTQVVSAIFFSGGYDPENDGFEALPDDTMGRSLYVVNALTGELIWVARNGTATGPTTTPTGYTHSSLVDSIPSDVSIGDFDGNGQIDRLVVGDTGGNVWRADLFGTPDTWKLNLVARLGRHMLDSSNAPLSTTASIAANDRRFFYAPDLVRSKNTDGTSFDAIVIGSGDREDPLDRDRLVTNAIYMIKDYAAAGAVPDTDGDGISNSVLDHTDIFDVTNDCLPSGTSNSTACSTLTNGWRLEMETNSVSSEKVLAQPVTIFNTIFVSTYIPPGLNTTSQTLCAPAEGGGRLYSLKLANANPADNTYSVDDSADQDPATGTTARDRYSVLSSGGIPSTIVYIPGVTNGSSKPCILRPDGKCVAVHGTSYYRTFWRREEGK